MGRGGGYFVHPSIVQARELGEAIGSALGREMAAGTPMPSLMTTQGPTPRSMSQSHTHPPAARPATKPTTTAPKRHQETSMKTQTDHNMRARLERLETAQERRELLASRPDLTANAKTNAWLESAPIADVRAACDSLARTDANASAPSSVSSADREHIRSRMRGGSQTTNPSGRATRMNGTKQEFLDMTPEQARARLAEIERARAGSSKRRSA
jgi:hypothetical protein